MSVPKFFEFLEPFLNAIKDGELHGAKEVRTKVAEIMGLTPADMEELLPSGRQTTFSNRVYWARTYLNKAGLIETPSRGRYHITDLGQAALSSGKKIDIKYLEQFDSFIEFSKMTVGDGSDGSDDAIGESPLEVLETAYNQVNATLASELMDEVMKLTPSDFEKLVVKLLLRMGYGSGIDKAGFVTPASHDGGIDGIIKEDQLGFSSFYIQAKQWALDSSVSKPEIQKFVGALTGQNAQKGLFITTAKFSPGALDYAKNLSVSKVVLVDGTALTKLMIKHNVGVSVEHIYEVKRLDSDFFTDEL